MPIQNPIRIAICLGNANKEPNNARSRREKREKQNKKPIAFRLPQTTAGVQYKANQSNDILDLAKKAPRRYNNRVLGVGFPRYAVGVCRLRYGAVCGEHSALPGGLFCFAFLDFIIMACKPESKVFFYIPESALRHSGRIGVYRRRSGRQTLYA
jgi:hypothetical protein